MHNPKINGTSSRYHAIAAKFANTVVICSLLLVLAVTSFPYDFFKENASNYNYYFLISEFSKSRNLSDVITNIFLFLPFGFGITRLLQKRNLRVADTLLITMFATFCLAWAVEIIQVFIPSRSSSFIDILASNLGGFLGFLCFKLWGIQILSYVTAFIEKIRRFLSIKKLAAAFIGYIVLTFSTSLVWQNSANLSNWDQTFPLLIGNEHTGDRPWKGYVSEVYIANKAVSEQEVAYVFSEKDRFISIKDSLVAAYQLIGKGSYPDQTGHLPDLSWRGNPPGTQDRTGISLNPSHWLETETSATFLTQKITETSQFTLGAIVATADTAQYGPARIISLSKNILQRNFTLGQHGSDLVFRVRTPITGENGTKYELTVPDVFADTNFHNLVITYKRSVLRVYIDSLEHSYSLKLTPEVLIFLHLLPFDANSINLEVYKILYYGFIFIPLGFFLALITAISRGRFSFYILLIYAGILLPSLILEGILASGTERAIRLDNLLLSMVITAITMLIVKRWIAFLLQTDMAG